MYKIQTTGFYACSYLPGKLACSEVVMSKYSMDAHAYGKLMRAGFRRSGHYVYRPCCEHCHACISVRVPVKTFVPKRNQRRAWKLHQQLLVTTHALHYNPAHYELYRRYQSKRHAGGGMDKDCREQYHNFLLQSHVDSVLVEFHQNDQLRIVSIIDILSDGLSSVYCFYDADIPNASFGTYNILWQIEQCRKLGLDYLYLGYWIKENQKMNYKVNFQPLEVLIGDQWQLLDSNFG